MVLCQYCQEGRKSQKSKIAHEIYCRSNPNRKEKKPSYGMKGKKGCNHITKAKERGLPIPVSEETKQKLSKIMLERNKTLWTKERRENNSIKRSKILEENGYGGFPHVKIYTVKNIEGEEYKVRGTWELRVAWYFNSCGTLWKRKQYLRYQDNEIKRTYTPDFYLPEKNLYIEVKGYFSEKDKRKMKLVQEQNDIDILIADGKNINIVLEKIKAGVYPLSYKQ